MSTIANTITLSTANSMTKAQLIEALMAAQAANAAMKDTLDATLEYNDVIGRDLEVAHGLAEELELTQQKLRASQAIVEKLTAEQPVKPQITSARAAYLAKLAANRAADLARLDAWNAKCAAARKTAMEIGKVVLV